MIVLRCLRPDRIIFACTNFVESKMTKQFVETKPTKLEDMFRESNSPSVPIIFVLSPGVDPSNVLNNFANKMGQLVETISLGKGQSKKAIKFLQEAAEKGTWVFLANCHLSISLLPELEKQMEIVFKQNVDENFRIFLSSNPHPKFPISLL